MEIRLQKWHEAGVKPAAEWKPGLSCHLVGVEIGFRSMVGRKGMGYERLREWLENSVVPSVPGSSWRVGEEN